MMLVASLAACASEFDEERVGVDEGSLGAEIYEVFCQRLASSELPTDVSGRETRALCSGDVGPEEAPTERLRVLAEQRDRLLHICESKEIGKLLHDLLVAFGDSEWARVHSCLIGGEAQHLFGNRAQ